MSLIAFISYWVFADNKSEAPKVEHLLTWQIHLGIFSICAESLPAIWYHHLEKERHNGRFLLWFSYLLQASSSSEDTASFPIWPIKGLNLVEIDSCPVVICLLSMSTSSWALQELGGYGVRREECCRKSRQQTGHATNSGSRGPFIYCPISGFGLCVRGTEDELVLATAPEQQITHTHRRTVASRRTRWLEEAVAMEMW